VVRLLYNIYAMQKSYDFLLL